MSNFDNIIKNSKKTNPSNIVLTKCLKEEDYIFFKINFDFNILNDYAKNIIQYIEFYRNRYNKHPTLEELSLKFTNIHDLIEVEYYKDFSNEYTIDKAKSEYKKNRMVSIIEEFALKLDEDSADSALSHFSKEISILEKISMQKASHISLFEASSDVLEFKPEKGFSYGLPSLDRNIGGIKLGEYIIICARPKGNKSFLARFMALNLIRQGADVIYIGFETSKKNELRNFVALESHVNPFLLLTNILGTEERNRVIQTIERFKSLKDKQLFEIMDASCFTKLSPNNIFATIQPLIRNPEKTVVFLDQASWLYDDEMSGNPVQTLTNISKAFVNFTSSTQIPLVALYQANRTTNGIIPNAKDIMWSDRPLQDCHVALGLGATPDMKKDKKKYIKTIAHRVGNESCLIADFDIENGIYKEFQGDVIDPDENSKKESIL